VLIPFEMYMNLRKIYFGVESLQRYYPKGISQQKIDNEPEEKYQMKSLLSVIADSGVVEIYILDKSDMAYLPDYILRKIYEKVALVKEADRPMHEEEIEQSKERMMRWQDFKVNAVDKMLKERYAEKNMNNLMKSQF